MINDDIRQLMAQIAELEDKLQQAVHDRQQALFFQIEGKRIRFKNDLEDAQKQLKTNLFTWLRKSKPSNVITAPIIYSMAIPLVFLDLCLSIYQGLCFPLYSVPRVSRSNYIVLDRHHLSYLNSIEKLNCLYCGYGNGVLAYAREIAARTEQFWCPIKHAHKVLDPHRRYARFADYGDGEAYNATMKRLRNDFADQVTIDK